MRIALSVVVLVSPEPVDAGSNDYRLTWLVDEGNLPRAVMAATGSGIVRIDLRARIDGWINTEKGSRMSESPESSEAMEALVTRVSELEARVALLESIAAKAPAHTRRAAQGSAAALSDAGDRPEWVDEYVVAELVASDTWIEIHEHSARPQLQRLIREVVHVEAPATERLILDRVRRAWGLRRAGGRVLESFDQAIRQLVARGHMIRVDDALVESADQAISVRVPGADDATKRSAEDIPKVELQLALQRLAESTGQAVAADDLMMAAARLFGWTRRGGAIQERLNTALEAAISVGQLERGSDGLVRVPALEPA